MDFAMQKCGLKNDWQNQTTVTPSFICVAKKCKVLLQSLLATSQKLEVLLTSKEKSAVKF
jgi:hypothetical protein